jgi:hypothetical protein
MFDDVLQTLFLFKFKQIFDIYTRSYPIADFALNHVRFRVAMYLTLNFVEFRTNHEPNGVHGVVHGGISLSLGLVNIET